MNTMVIFLVVTLGVSPFGHKGYGGVSVTPVPTLHICETLRAEVIQQINTTYGLKSHDRGELVVRCVTVGEKNDN
jgi:hypothetical protein